MFSRALYRTLSGAWPMVFIFCIILVTVRISYLRINHQKFSLFNEIYTLIFLIYILLLFELVTNTESGGSGLNLMPFKEITRYTFGSPLFIYNVLGNILAFVPFGYFVSSYVKAKRVGEMTIITLITSLAIELVQYRIGRTFDIDDIILNVAGGIIGFLIYIAITAIQKHLPSLFKSDLFYNILSIIVIVIIIAYISQFVGFGWLNGVIK